MKRGADVPLVERESELETIEQVLAGASGGRGAVLLVEGGDAGVERLRAPRRLQLTGVAALTPMERRTATLAADGLTNREVAQSLFPTVRTVEMHLTHAYRKLGVGSRRELGRVLAG